jgi:hypothetical protein
MKFNDRPTTEDIKLEKKRLMAVLNEVEADALQLISRIDKAKIELEKTENADDVTFYNENNDFDEENGVTTYLELNEIFNAKVEVFTIINDDPSNKMPVYNGDKLTVGQYLLVAVTPDDGYKCDLVELNGNSSLKYIEGFYVFKIEEGINKLNINILK